MLVTILGIVIVIIFAWLYISFSSKRQEKDSKFEEKINRLIRQKSDLQEIIIFLLDETPDRSTIVLDKNTANKELKKIEKNKEFNTLKKQINDVATDIYRRYNDDEKLLEETLLNICDKINDIKNKYGFEKDDDVDWNNENDDSLIDDDIFDDDDPVNEKVEILEKNINHLEIQKYSLLGIVFFLLDETSASEPIKRDENTGKINEEEFEALIYEIRDTVADMLARHSNDEQLEKILFRLCKRIKNFEKLKTDLREEDDDDDDIGEEGGFL